MAGVVSSVITKTAEAWPGRSPSPLRLARRVAGPLICQQSLIEVLAGTAAAVTIAQIIKFFTHRVKVGVKTSIEITSGRLDDTVENIDRIAPKKLLHHPGYIRRRWCMVDDCSVLVGHGHELHAQGIHGLESDSDFAARITSRLARKREFVACEAEFKCSRSPGKRHLEEETVIEK